MANAKILYVRMSNLPLPLHFTCSTLFADSLIAGKYQSNLWLKLNFAACQTGRETHPHRPTQVDCLTRANVERLHKINSIKKPIPVTFGAKTKTNTIHIYVPFQTLFCYVILRLACEIIFLLLSLGIVPPCGKECIKYCFCSKLFRKYL